VKFADLTEVKSDRLLAPARHRKAATRRTAT